MGRSTNSDVFNWKRYIEVLALLAYKAVTKLMRAHATETFYGFAFHELYRETGGIIAQPCLAANSMQALEADDCSNWSTPDWHWPDIRYGNMEFGKLHRKLQREAEDGSQAQWYKLEKRFLNALVKTARLLHKKLHGHKQLNKYFAVMVLDENDDDLLLARKSAGKGLFQYHFPELALELEQKKNMRKSDPVKQLKKYAQDLWSHEKEILALGKIAVPVLVQALNDKEQHWVAADLLGKLGIPDKSALSSLRSLARKGNEVYFHETNALALLGDTDFLLALAKNKKTRGIAIDGITCLYGSAVEYCLHPPVLDYGPLEKLLSLNSCKTRVKKLWSGRALSLEDVDEALRGLQSSHAVIRENAASLLGDRNLGSKAGAKILPALSYCLGDRARHVYVLKQIA